MLGLPPLKVDFRGINFDIKFALIGVRMTKICSSEVGPINLSWSSNSSLELVSNQNSPKAVKTNLKLHKPISRDKDNSQDSWFDYILKHSREIKPRFQEFHERVSRTHL